jgi:Ribosomal RNA adenine dimethylase
MRLISRFCSKLAVDALKEKRKSVPEKIKNVPKKSKFINEIDVYLSNSPLRAAVHEIPSRFKNCLSNPPDSLICVDSTAASKYIFIQCKDHWVKLKYHHLGTIAVAILQNVTSGTLQNLHLLEMAPGPGFLSKNLLDLGATNLRLYEPHPQFNGQLQKKALGLNSKLQVFPQDLHNLARVLFMDQVLQLGQMDSIMDGLNSGTLCNFFSKISAVK